MSATFTNKRCVVRETRQLRLPNALRHLHVIVSLRRRCFVTRGTDDKLITTFEKNEVDYLEQRPFIPKHRGTPTEKKTKNVNRNGALGQGWRATRTSRNLSEAALQSERAPRRGTARGAPISSLNRGSRRTAPRCVPAPVRSASAGLFFPPSVIRRGVNPDDAAGTSLILCRAAICFVAP